MGPIQFIINGWCTLRASSIFVRNLIFGESGTIQADQPERQPEPELAPKKIFTLQSLPVETLLHAFSFLELKPYIIAHGVCTDWRRLLPEAQIHPIRHRLFDFYHHIINTPHFLNTRRWTLENLQPFDRQGYIDALLSQYPVIPDEFRLWILEWPARLAIGCTWPGLPFTESCTASSMRRPGVNWLGYNNTSPQLLAAMYKPKPTDDYKFIPGLIVWRDTSTTDWLVFDEDEPDLFGRVYVIDMLEYHSRSGVIPSGRPEGHDTGNNNHSNDDDDNDDSISYDDDDSYEPYINIAFADWINYLEDYWNNAAKFISSAEIRGDYARPDLVISQPIPFRFNQALAWTRPSPLWTQRHTATKYLFS